MHIWATWWTFRTQARKIQKKKKNTEKMFYIFPKKEDFLIFWGIISMGEWNFRAPSLKVFLYFFKDNFFLYFRRELLNTEKQKKPILKKFLIFFPKKIVTTFWGDCRSSRKIKNPSYSRMTAD